MNSQGCVFVWLTQGTFLRIRCWMYSVWEENELLLIQTRFYIFKTILQSPGSSVNIMTRQRARQSRNYLSIPGWSNILSLARVHSEYTSQTFSCLLGDKALSLELKYWHVSLATHHNVVTVLRMNGAIFPPHPCLHDLSLEFVFTSPQIVVKTIKTAEFSMSHYLLCLYVEKRG
jgi:hypothetical protein